MADISSSQIFLFLAKNSDWKTKADTNGDGSIQACEMRDYLNTDEFKDFAGVKIEDCSAKTFNDFWNKLDAGVKNNKLDKSEEDKLNAVAGSYVQDGKVARSGQVRIVRDGIVIGDDKIAGLQRFKDSVKEVAAGFECGISLEKFTDIKEGDIFEAYIMEEYQD